MTGSGEINDSRTSAERLEYILLDIAEEIGDVVFEGYGSGEVSLEELKQRYTLLRQWVSIGETLLHLHGSNRG